LWQAVEQLSSIRVTSSGKEIITQLIKDAKAKKSVFVGVQGSAERVKKPEDKENPTNVEIAMKNEFGIGVPERSFIRASVEENREKYLNMNKLAVKKILARKLTTETYLENLGEIAASDMQKFAIDLKQPPNSAETIEKKRSENPLIDTGQMVGSITYKVEDNERS
jgi:hypothetical protein